MANPDTEKRRRDGWPWILVLAGLFGVLETTLRVLILHANSFTFLNYATLLGLSFATYLVLIGLPALILSLLARGRSVSSGALTAGLAVFLWSGLIWHTELEAGVKWHSLTGILGSLAAAAIGLAVVLLLHAISARRLTVVTAVMVAALAVVPAARLDRSAKDLSQPDDPQAGWYFVLLTDTVGTRHLPLYGYERDTAPNLSRFAEESVVYEHAIAPSSWTRPSVASLFTSLYLQRHDKDAGVSYLRPACRSLAELFYNNGYATAGFSSSGVVTQLSNFDQGFRHFDDTCAGQSVRQVYGHMYLLHYVVGPLAPAIRYEITKPERRRAENVNRLFFDWYEKSDLPGGFVYLHYFDAHGPYAPPKGFDVFGRQPMDLHDGEILYWDSQFQAFLDFLKEKGICDKATIVVTADHGEEFYEHGATGHGQSLYQELIHVPLVIKTPGAGPRRVPGNVSLVDIGPTLLELAQLPPLLYADGVSLVASLQGEDLPERVVQSRINHIQNVYRRALIGDPWKAILQPDAGLVELYDLRDDPLEQNDVAADNLAVVNALIADLRESERLTWLPAEVMDSEDFQVSPELQHTLRALGYIQ